MPRQWYGNAQSAKSAPRTHNGVRTLQAVGGTLHTVRAIYGSTDAAKDDHSNDSLCRVASHKQAARLHSDLRQYDGPQYGPNVMRYASHEVRSTLVASVPDAAQTDQTVDFLVKRAIARKMTLAAYCATIGVQL